MFLADFVCLSVCQQVNSKSFEILRVCWEWHKLPVIQFWG